MTLRARLFIAFLTLALLPTAVFTAFTLVQLERATGRSFRPGVDRALEAALQVTKNSLARMDATVLAQAGDWGQALPARPLTEPHRGAVRDGLRAAGLDFVQLYRLDQGRWRRVDEVLPERVIQARTLDLSDEIEAGLASGRLLHSQRGALAGVARMHDSTWVLVAGMNVPPDFFQQVDEVGQGRSHYGRLGVLVGVQRLYVALLVLALVVLVGLLALALSTTLARQMAQPLTELSEALGQVSGGDLSVRVTPRGARELRVLGVAFNDMTARLERAREQLVAAGREAAWREVARRLAHEIRNPLTAMRYALHRLQRRAELVPDQEREAVRQSLAALLQELEHLTTMAGQFAQYARLPEPHAEPLDLADVARDAAGLHAPEQVKLELDDGPLPVLGDKLMLSRAVQNLIVNAREASPDGAPVVVRAARENGAAALEVLDRGSGPPPGLGARVFDPYVSTKQRGSGLGLSLVRDVVQQHGGRVTLAAREGGGARARVELPLAEPGGA
ncbi:MAG TPA: ATP-binding protein [Candidatus Eisenbacteria bacterium]|nr:ATP-binding protein [Candidatus Eisenbacteria bacterium]